MFSRLVIASENDTSDDDPDGLGGLSSLIHRAFDKSSYAMMIADAKPLIITVNRAFTTITGWRRDEVVGRNPSVLSSGRHDGGFYKALWRDLMNKHHWQGEIWNRRKDGAVYPEWLTIDAIRDEKGDLSHFIAVFADITKRKQESDALEHLAFHDALTGLPNRRLFEDRLEHDMARSRRDSLRFALMAMDLDDFKTINDIHGHDIGDRLLVAAGERMTDAIRASDTLARVGGDEFLILIPSIKCPDDAMLVARKILTAVSRPYEFLGRNTVVGASMGVCIFPDHGDNPTELVRVADQAMYRAKDEGKGVIRLA